MTKKISLRVLSLVISFLMLVSLASVGIVSASDINDEDFGYLINDKGEVTITGVSHDLGYDYLVIPDTIQGYPVVYIDGAFAFDSYDTIVLPVTMKSMDQVFYKGSVDRIEYLGTREMWQDVYVYARNETFGCTVISCADDKTYGDYIYGVADNKAVIVGYTGTDSELTIPDKIEGYPVTEIGGRAFYGNEHLTQVTFGKYVERIEGEAFAACKNLTDIYIPKSFRSFGYDAFEDSALKNIYYSGNESMWEYIGYMKKLETELEGTYPVNTRITYAKKHFLEEGIKDNGSFEYYELDSKIYIIDYIGSDTQVVVPKKIDDMEVADIHGIAFEDKQFIKSIEVLAPVSTTSFNNLEALESVTLAEGIMHIKSYAFYECPKLTNVDLPSTLKTIGGYAFSDCTSLVEIDLPHNMDKLGYGVFSGCTSLESIVVPEGIISLEFSMFEECTSLKNVTLPGSLEVIEFYAFKECTSLKNVTLPGSLEVIDSYAFEECTSLKNVTLPGSLEVIGSHAFEDCSSLERVYIPENVSIIGEDVFDGCTSLAYLIVDEDNAVYDSRDNCNSVIETKTNKLIFVSKNSVVPNGVEILGEGVYEGCVYFKEIHLPSSLKEIEYYAFLGCTAESIVISEGVEVIGNCAFSRCKNLEEVTIPASVTSCVNSRGMFKDCYALRDIYYGGTEEQWDDVFGDVFGNSYNNATIHFAKVSKALGDANCDGDVNVKDATEIQKALAEIVELQEKGAILADTDRNGKVNVRDATAIQKWVADIETGFPIGEELKA